MARRPGPRAAVATSTVTTTCTHHRWRVGRWAVIAMAATVVTAVMVVMAATAATAATGWVLTGSAVTAMSATTLARAATTAFPHHVAECRYASHNRTATQLTADGRAWMCHAQDGGRNCLQDGPMSSFVDRNRKVGGGLPAGRRR
jgi:hypothetical protein